MLDERRKEWLKYIKDRNISRIRIDLEAINSLDPNGRAGDVDECLELLKSEMSEDELYEKHDDTLTPILPKEQWTRDYFNKQKVELGYNFSKERFQHVRELGKYLFPIKKPNPSNSFTKNNEKYMINTKIKVIVGLAIVVVVILVIATR